MWFDVLKTFILAQTEQEKEMTYFGLIFFGFFLFVLFMDSMSKGRLIPTKGPIKKIIIFSLIIVALVVFLLTYLFK